MVTFFLVGLFLVIPGALVIWAKRSATLRVGIESFLRLFLLGKDDGLFDHDKQYTLIVQWFYWGAIPTAIMIVLPSHIIWDAVFGLGLAGFIYVLLRFFTKKYPETPTGGNTQR